MFAKIGIVICIAASIINYGNNRPVLFWLSITALIVTFTSSLASSLIKTRPAVKQMEKEFRQMQARGVPKKDIDAFLAKKTDIKSVSLASVPTWVPSLTLISIVAGIILLIIGIVNRI